MLFMLSGQSSVCTAHTTHIVSRLCTSRHNLLQPSSRLGNQPKLRQKEKEKSKPTEKGTGTDQLQFTPYFFQIPVHYATHWLFLWKWSLNRWKGKKSANGLLYQSFDIMIKRDPGSCSLSVCYFTWQELKILLSWNSNQVINSRRTSVKVGILHYTRWQKKKLFTAKKSLRITRKIPGDVCVKCSLSPIFLGLIRANWLIQQWWRERTSGLLLVSYTIGNLIGSGSGLAGRLVRKHTRYIYSSFFGHFVRVCVCV